ncbi:MAG: hypothetical protein ACI9JN_000547 [Bacteroidia bacterium]|jgi:hypothetical protein
MNSSKELAAKAKLWGLRRNPAKINSENCFELIYAHTSRNKTYGMANMCAFTLT